jgi:predicted RNA-binding Zn-ribbon protein involved in translation (DUF1610 family)
MARPLKINEVPVAPFSLREAGPLQVDAATRKLGGKQYRLAPGAKVDPRATIDPNPCPECGGQVEWAATSRRTDKGLERYVFARCRRNQNHRWGFRAPHAGEDTVATPQAVGAPLVDAIEKELRDLDERRAKLEEMRELAKKLAV